MTMAAMQMAGMKLRAQRSWGLSVRFARSGHPTIDKLLYQALSVSELTAF
jgi:hypothetical protein